MVELKITELYKKAIVTGGAGFIGSHIVESLLRDGLEVISVDDYSGGKKSNLAHCHKYDGFREVKCDITDRSELERYFDGVDVVFNNAASKMTVCLKDPMRDLAVNAQGAFNIMELYATAQKFNNHTEEADNLIKLKCVKCVL